MTETQIQSLLNDYEARIRRYAQEIKNGPQTFSGVENAYEKVFQDGGIDVVNMALKMVKQSKKKPVPHAERDLSFASIVKELSLD
jgi:hypothetical protein